MFLRRYERRSGGRRRTYWALVESVRTGRGSRQRVVAYLGKLERSAQSGWAQLGRSLSGKQRPARSLFDPPHYDDPSEEEPVLVRLRDVRLERLRDFGDVWMALGLWRLLGLDKLLDSLTRAGRRGDVRLDPQHRSPRKRKGNARAIPESAGRGAAENAVRDRERPAERRSGGEPPQGIVIEKILRHNGLWQPSTPRPPPNRDDWIHDPIDASENQTAATDEPREVTFVDMDTFWATF